MNSFFKRDSVWTGLVIGIILPVVVYAVLFLLYSFLDSIGVFSDIGFAEDFRTRTLGLISICSNLILMQTIRKSYRNETTRGILIASMILVFIWFFKFGFKLLHL
ncbi:MAG TPA: hypothetical protein VFF90_05765 [Saprospiraceae bacterium]|nr:hypothetical protein [Saprospiraceae bacterium]